MCWAIGISKKRFGTLLYMVLSWLLTMGGIVAFVYIYGAVFKLEYRFGAMIAALTTIPSFLVPAVVGQIHARRTKRKPNTGLVDNSKA